MAKRRKKIGISKTLILSCIISGIAVLILRIINRRLEISELGELSSYIGTAFAVSLMIIIGILVVNMVNKK
jgi:hypothetical protein